MRNSQEEEIAHLRALVASLGNEVGAMKIEQLSLQIKYNGVQRDYEEAQRQLLTKVSDEKEGK